MQRILVLTIFCALTPAYADLTNGLVAYYPFNGNASDETGNGYNAIVSNVTLCPDRFGNPNSAYSFNGSNSYIRVAQQIISTNPFTWSVWFKGFAPSSQGTILNQGGNPSAGNSSPSLWVQPNGQFVFYTYASGAHQIASPIPTSYDSNLWHAVVGTSDAQGNRCLYVNGVCVATGTNQPFGQRLSNFYMGGTVPNMSQWVSGVIDDVRVYNRGLSASEVQQLYDYESGPRVHFVKAFTLDYSGLSVGTNYQLQASTDLSTWTNYGAPFTATSINYTNTSYQRIDDWNELFFRLQVSP